MTDHSPLNPDDYQDQEKMQKIVRVLILAVAKVPEEHGRDAIWGGLEALQQELNKPLSPPPGVTQH